jgi:hypothetical protein
MKTKKPAPKRKTPKATKQPRSLAAAPLFARSLVDWAAVDWGVHDAEIARRLGVSRTIVGKTRAKFRAAASKRPKKQKPLTDRQRLNFLESLVGRFVLEDCWKSKQSPTGKRRDTCGSDLHCGDNVQVYIRDSLSRVIVSASAPTWRQAIDAAAHSWANVPALPARGITTKAR